MKCRRLLAFTLTASMALCAGVSTADTVHENVLEGFSFENSPQQLAEEMNARFDNGAYVISDGYGVDSTELVEVLGTEARITAYYSVYDKPILFNIAARYLNVEVPLDAIDSDDIYEKQKEAVAVFASVLENTIAVYGPPDGGLFTYRDEETGDTLYFDFPLTEEGALQSEIVLAACMSSTSLIFDLHFGNVWLTFSQQISPWDYMISCRLDVTNPDLVNGEPLTTLQGYHGPYPLDP